jgi:hypothetical protein
MDHNLWDRFCTSTNAAIDLAGCYWEPWLSMWKIGFLLLVEPWDNATRAFTKGGQSLLHRHDNSAGYAHAVRNAPAASNSDKTNALRMHDLAKPAPYEPQVHVFCPSCGELTTIRAMGPMLLQPSMEEITYCCVACGTETRVQLTRHARLSIDVNEAR